MQGRELLILDKLLAHPDSSQREIAVACGISLGQTNLIIKQLCDDGLIRQDIVSKKKIKYSLTQRGLAERLRLSNEDILSAVKKYRKIKNMVTSLLNKLYEKGYREFILEGERGEIHEVISEVFDGNFRGRASLMWGPAEAKENQVVLNLDRRFSKNAVNVLHEITI